MPRFFYEDLPAEHLTLSGEDAQHISRVLRMKVGEKLTVSCADRTDCDCVIESFTADSVSLSVIRTYPNESEPSVSLTLYQALPKSDKMDFIIQKAVELGVSRIVPILTKRCVSRPDAKSMKKKCERFQKISKEAAKQSGRGVIPQIGGLMSFEEALQEARKHEKVLLCYENGGQRIPDLVEEKMTDIGLFIGSEGGFEEYEVEQAIQSAALVATLGKRILRCETAPLAAMTVIMSVTGNI